jgi:protein O-mannosyl-transferase
VPLSLRAGWLWFLLLLLPVLGLVQIGGQAFADRWLYLPTSGLVAGVAFLLPPGARRAALTLPVVLGFLTFAALPSFADSERVFAHALEVDGDNFMAHTNLGAALEARGDMAAAEAHYAQAVASNPTWPVALVNLGTALARRGQLDAAVELFQRALAIDPGHGLAEYNLALALAQQGRLDAALPHYGRAVQLRPDDAQAALGHGAVLVMTGQIDPGVAELERALSLKPGDPETLGRLESARKLKAQ